MNKKWDRSKTYEIQVRNSAGATLSLYVGPWNGAADIQWKVALRYVSRRVLRHITDSEVLAFLYGHPDLIEVEKHLDDNYVMPGDKDDPPNRKGAA